MQGMPAAQELQAQGETIDVQTRNGSSRKQMEKAWLKG